MQLHWRHFAPRTNNLKRIKRIAFIPARSGSKGIENKNLLKLNGKTLLERAISTALLSEVFDSVMVSTDCESYAEIAIAAGAEVPFLRHKELALDSTRTIEVLLDFFDRLNSFDSSCTRIFLLQPTSPFRSVNHIRDSSNLVGLGTRSLISIVDVKGHHPYRMQTFDGKTCSSYMPFSDQDFSPRQTLPKIYIRNGAIYTSMLSFIFQSKKLIEGAPLGYEMTSLDSINIDSIEDFWLAQKLIEMGIRA
jgi:CMP-N,N'-diacetyllegionaminic acid synthase